MSTTLARTWDDLTPAERAAERRANAAALGRHKSTSGSSLDPARMADADLREAAAELAGSPEAAAIARGHRAPG